MNVQQSIKARIELLKNKLLLVCGGKRYRKFIILTRARTGSNMLVSFLNSHPNISASGEVFSKLNGRDYKNILMKQFGKEPYFVKAKGFKIFYYHPQDEDDSKIWRDLINMNDLYVVHLKRRNILRTLISRKIAYATGQWSKTVTTSENRTLPKQVSFTVKELEDDFKETEKWEKDADEMFSQHNSLSLFYEDLVSETQTKFRKICDFLGVEYERSETVLKKQNPERARDLISNFDELKAEFMGTKWQGFFEEQ